MKVSLLKPGIAAGVIASAIFPFLAGKSAPEETLPPTVTASNKQADNKSVQDIIDSLAKLRKMRDERQEETMSVEITWTTARKHALALYKAEAEDVRALREGKITEKDRKVKICFTD